MLDAVEQQYQNMPRRQKKKRSSGRSTEVCDETTMADCVATVNKATRKSSRSGGGSVQIVENDATMQVGKRASNDDSNSNKKRFKKARKVAKGADEKQRAATEVSFVDGEQLIKTTVDSADESFLYSDKDDSDEEMVDSKEALVEEEASQGSEIEFAVQSRSRPDDVGENMDRKTDGNVDQDVLARREQLKRIDEEMKIKLRELQDLIEKGGLSESAKALKGCQKKHKGEPVLNTNCNATKVRASVQENTCKTSGSATRSKETIYEEAVKRMSRVSSSSEEEMVNTSDEFEHKMGLMNNLNNSQGLVISGDVNTQGLELGESSKEDVVVTDTPEQSSTDG